MKLFDKTDKELITLYKNCDRLKNERKNALTLMKEIEKEWGKRLSDVRKGEYMFSIADEGMLSAFGYHVGDFGLNNNETRKYLLDIIVNCEYLPPIFCETRNYTFQWGKAKSSKRINKLLNVLGGLKYAHKNKASLKNAVKHWDCDYEFITNKYKDLCKA